MEEKYIEKILRAQQGDRIALGELMEETKWIVTSVVNKYCDKRNAEYEDLLQEGNIHLMTAIRKFDTNMNVKLSTFAYPIIEKWTRFNIKKKTSEFCYSRTTVELGYKAKKMLEDNKTLTEISKELGKSTYDISEALNYIRPMKSTDECIGNEEDSNYSVKDSIGCRKTEEDMSQLELCIDMKKRLTLEEYQIFEICFIKGLQQKDAVALLGGTTDKMQVSRIVKRIKNKAIEYYNKTGGVVISG